MSYVYKQEFGAFLQLSLFSFLFFFSLTICSFSEIFASQSLVNSHLIQKHIGWAAKLQQVFAVLSLAAKPY